MNVHIYLSFSEKLNETNYKLIDNLIEAFNKKKTKDLTCIIETPSDIYSGGGSKYDSLAERSTKINFAVFVYDKIEINKKDIISKMNREDIKEINKMNFELGYFSKRLGPQKCFLVYLSDDHQIYPLPEQIDNSPFYLSNKQESPIAGKIIERIKTILAKQQSEEDIYYDRVLSKDKNQWHLKVGIVDYPPFCTPKYEMEKIIDAEGLYPILLKKIIKSFNREAKMKYSWELVNWDNLYRAITTDFDILISVFATGYRTQLGRSCRTIHQVPICGLCKKSNTRIPDTIEALITDDRIKIGLLKGEIGYVWAEETLLREGETMEKERFVYLEGTQDIEKLVSLLDDNRADIIVCDALSLYRICEKRDHENFVVKFGYENPLRWGNNTFIVKNNQIVFRDKINEKLEDLLNDRYIEERDRAELTNYKAINITNFKGKQYV
ncbi:MAG: transporter substrate-binding domain-containing protein [Ignavibacteriae bacterium]|nr:transporter substrate-binding domain-containing protein [Ignavibacteriota bacterium]